MVFARGTLIGVPRTTIPVPAADTVYQDAINASATSIMEPADQPDGERRGALQDRFGNKWYISSPR